MKVVVFAYQSIGYVCLEELVCQGHEVALVATVPDDPGENIWFQSVAELARSLGLPVVMPDNPNTPEFVEHVRRLQPDIIFSFYYRHMLKPDLLALPPLGALNMHGSYLPKYRGRCPVNWVLIHGEQETGVTLHYMVAKADAGDIVGQRKFPITFEDTALDLYRKMIPAAREVLAEALPLLAAGTAPRIVQDPSQASYFGGRKPADGLFQWSWPPLRIYNLVRAVTHPYPGAFVETPAGRLMVWACRPVEGWPGEAAPGTVLAVEAEGPVIATRDGALRILAAQINDKAEATGAQVAAALGLSPGDTLAPA